MSFWEPCWACRIMSGEDVGSIVEETNDVVAVINPFSISAGHTLIMPRKHLKNIYELEEKELAGAILEAAARIARAAKKAFNADGITLRQNNEAASDQHLFHFHLHVIPRFEGDLERFNSSPEMSSREMQRSAAAKLSAELS
jgi:histidine triad (HIT) family protein